jgi:hypothetical protein
VNSFQNWVRRSLIGDLSIPATFVIVLALGFNYAGQHAAAMAFGAVGAVLVFLKYRAKRGAAKN